jgi:toxin ParE1/3/4
VRRLRILEAAAEEAIEAAAWYERQCTGLGADFGDALDAALDLLETDVVPLTVMSGEAGRLGAKRIVLSRFPYDVVVRETLDELLVVAVAHHARKPGYWRSRLDH